MRNKILYLMMMLVMPAFILLSCTKDDEGDDDPVDTNTPPTASFTVTPQVGNTQTEFELDATACSDAETPANELLIRWDLNDDGAWESDYVTERLAIATYGGTGTFTIRLEVKDGGGKTATTTRQVTVGDNLSPVLSDPNPSDGAVDVATNATLSWTATDPDQDPMTFDVYFGNTQNPEKVTEGISDPSHSQGLMAENTTYYWKVVAYDDHGNITEGPIWSFTTAGGAAFNCGDDITDNRDGKVYPTVLIGEQCWMAKNMNIGVMTPGSEDQSDDSEIEKYCYGDNEANCNTYGGLYQWDEMRQYASDNTKGICPEGWHLPSLQEWQALEMELGMSQAAANATSGWQGTDQGTQLKQGGSSGFEALLGGYRNTNGNFLTMDFVTAFWTATQASSTMGTTRFLDSSHSEVSHTNNDKRYGNAVRCLKN